MARSRGKEEERKGRRDREVKGEGVMVEEAEGGREEGKASGQARPASFEFGSG